MDLSIIVPTLNEEARIASVLERLRAIDGVGEIIVVDGGSSDGTVAAARAVAARHGTSGATASSPSSVGAAASPATSTSPDSTSTGECQQQASGRSPAIRLAHAPRGRGTQMNVGARIAFGDALLFLHADATLPVTAAQWVAGALAKPDVVAGAFRVRTVADGPRRWLAPFLRLADLRSRITRLPYGDQALFVRREAFERVGGFPEQPLMEDLELALRLRRLGRIEIVPAVVEVSGRRFLAHPIMAVLAMRIFPLLYRLGVSPRLLARLYGNPR